MQALLTNRERTARGLELLVFLALIVPPTILRWFEPSVHDTSLPLLVAGSILSNGALLALVCYFNWRSRESLAYLGLQFEGLAKEALLGLLLFVPFAAFATGLSGLLEALGLVSVEAPIPRITSTLELTLAGFALATIAIVEETIFRGYLLTRFVEWRRGRKTLAILMSSLIFALGHEYQGPAGVLTVAGMGAMFAGVYLWRGSLIAPIVLHYLQDAFAVVAIGTR